MSDAMDKFSRLVDRYRKASPSGVRRRGRASNEEEDIHREVTNLAMQMRAMRSIMLSNTKEMQKMAKNSTEIAYILQRLKTGRGDPLAERIASRRVLSSKDMGSLSEELDHVAKAMEVMKDLPVSMEKVVSELEKVVTDSRLDTNFRKSVLVDIRKFLASEGARGKSMEALKNLNVQTLQFTKAEQTQITKLMAGLAREVKGKTATVGELTSRAPAAAITPRSVRRALDQRTTASGKTVRQALKDEPALYSRGRQYAGGGSAFGFGAFGLTELDKTLGISESVAEGLRKYTDPDERARRAAEKEGRATVKGKSFMERTRGLADLYGTGKPQKGKVSTEAQLTRKVTKKALLEKSATEEALDEKKRATTEKGRAGAAMLGGLLGNSGALALIAAQGLSNRAKQNQAESEKLAEQMEQGDSKSKRAARTLRHKMSDNIGDRLMAPAEELIVNPAMSGIESMASGLSKLRAKVTSPKYGTPYGAASIRTERNLPVGQPGVEVKTPVLPTPKMQSTPPAPGGVGPTRSPHAIGSNELGVVDSFFLGLT